MVTEQEIMDLITANTLNLHEAIAALEIYGDIIEELNKVNKAQKKAIEELSERVVVLEEESMYRALMSQAGSSH